MPSLRMMPKVLTLTDAAASRVAALIAQKPGVKALKIGVKKGGCAGMEYTMTWADEIGKFDEIVEEKGAIVPDRPDCDHVSDRQRNGLQNRQALDRSSCSTTRTRRAPAAAEKASTSNRRRRPDSLPPKAEARDVQTDLGTRGFWMAGSSPAMTLWGKGLRSI